ncbi:dephospho-CoA kinase [Mycobacterium shigaense]|uniref:Dephospho-CoA kinase n=1 Tax=Mycobacterium shigaense TaxID=722731 RepID=A0A1Z4EHR1_9MYCO|nr:dephospho-CoA kinase [Mycobacterium shigaense]MEA1124628.1 dephospho-CoA kinase [Mycobacterium shigaense]PRI13973.1 dephospho-CoA kinase [Mycobacterium shigaense]BAX92440.1 dephospho-CoA kinase [Mycobacterium shigaense]
MLRIGLTGGIGAGKSALSATFAECGGVIVDGDVISREVVQPGTEGLASLVEAFGEDILQPDGSLDRPALAAKAFASEEARKQLNAIVHPLVGKRRAEIIASVPEDSVVVEDIPLLVESGMAPMFPLVVVVHADVELRVRRLVEQRGMSEDDARARIAAQADDDQRRAVADIWIDNSGSQEDLVKRARDVWEHRIVPFAHNVAERRIVRAPARVVPADPTWPDQARRIVARLATACGHLALRVDHIGSTAVPEFDAKDVIDVQVTVESLAVADELAEALLGAGYPRWDHITEDTARSDARSTVADYDHRDDAALWRKRIHASADPGRPTNVHLRVNGWPNQQFGLLFVDWLAANPQERAGYLDVKRAAEGDAGGDIASYAGAKEPWLADAYRRAWDWADFTGWRP